MTAYLTAALILVSSVATAACISCWFLRQSNEELHDRSVKRKAQFRELAEICESRRMAIKSLEKELSLYRNRLEQELKNPQP